MEQNEGEAARSFSLVLLHQESYRSGYFGQATWLIGIQAFVD
jgi:hypothetical protein